MDAKDPVKALIKHVGRGKTLARDLSPDQAREALRRILAGEFAPAQLGAFLQALRIKETNADELVAAALGVREFLVGMLPPTPGPAEHPLVVNLGFDTARKGGIVSLLAASLLRSLRLARPVVVWEPAINFPGNDSFGRTLEALRSHPLLAAGEVPRIAVQEMVPAWESLREIRAQIGFRSILNTLEKVVSPWPTAPLVLGISHDTFSERLCRVAHRLGSPRGAVLQGHHGTCDLGWGEKPTEATVWNGEEVRDLALDPAGLPWRGDSSVLLVSRMAEWPTLIQDPRGPLWDAVRLQAAYLLAIARDLPWNEAAALIATHPDTP